MTVSEIIAIYERLSPENQTQLREFVQTLISARKDGVQEGKISSDTSPATNREAR